ncbi:hypothetical protein D1007_58635 [Hordeum vulgare]|nr:hypothetical protein D1007_58635 [Hordeum vulgare]
MEAQGGARREKWGDNSTQVAAGGSTGGRHQEMRQHQLHQPPDRRHPTPGKRNVSPLVGGAEIVPSSVSGKKFSSYLDACMGEPVVIEMDPSETSGHQKMQSYLVQSPDNSGEKVEVIPTPPVREEMQVRFNIIRELEISRANIAKKVDKNDKQQDKILFITNAAGEASPLDTEWVGDEGLDVDDFTVLAMAETVKQGAQLLKESAAQMLLLCGPPRPESTEQADEEEASEECLVMVVGTPGSGAGSW